MNTKQVFIILVATLFLAVSIGSAQAQGKGPKTDSINLNSSRSNVYKAEKDPTIKTPTADSTTVKGSKSNSSDRKAVKDSKE